MTLISRACCCCRLSTGGMLLGWLGGVIYLVNMTTGITMFTMDKVIGLPDDTPASKAEFIELVARVILGLDILVSFINFIGCICLMVGTMKRMKNFLLPWLFGQILVILTWIVADLVIITIIINNYSIVYVVSIIVVTGAILFIMYLWICVYSFYQELRNSDRLLKHAYSYTPDAYRSNTTSIHM